MKTEETEQIRKLLWKTWHKTFDIITDVGRIQTDTDKLFQLLTVIEAEEEK